MSFIGHSKINVPTQLYPSDVVTPTAGHIIVCDYKRHVLHVLSGQGDILTLLGRLNKNVSCLNYYTISLKKCQFLDLL
jgi:hypothetical protein